MRALLLQPWLHLCVVWWPPLVVVPAAADGASGEATCASGAGCMQMPPSESDGAVNQDDADGHGAAMPPVLMGSYQVSTPAELKAEVIAAEAALSLKAVVDGAPQVYDSPSVSISVRKVSNELLARESIKVEAPDGAAIDIPKGVQGKTGGPVTVTVTSYHATEKIMKELPKIKYGTDRLEGIEAKNETTNATEEKNRTLPDRVDFFTTKSSVTWRGTVNVKYAGLSASVPAHDRSPGKGPDGAKYGEDEVKYPEEKDEIRKAVEGLAGMPETERAKGFRQLARRWHPDKNPLDALRAAELFNYVQELRETMLGDGVFRGALR